MVSDADLGQYTDPAVAHALKNPQSSPRHLAVHFESNAQASNHSDRRDSASLLHADICASVLAEGIDPLPPHWTAGLLDASPVHDDALWLPLNARAGYSLATISVCASQSYDQPGDAAIFAQRTNLLVLEAAGNKGFQPLSRHATQSFSALFHAPGYFRVGECDPQGRVTPHSSACGPAFVCAHPFFDPEMTFDTEGTPPLRNLRGTSLSAPHAGAMLVRHTADCTDARPYDVIPAALLAASQRPASRGLGSVRNAAGLVFDRLQTGFGALSDEALAEQAARLRPLLDSRPMPKLSEPMLCRGRTQGERVFPRHTINVDGRESLIVKISGHLFYAKNPDEPLDEKRLPLSVALVNPATQTRMTATSFVFRPRLSSMKTPDMVRVGFTTAGFFGEPFQSGQWGVGAAFPNAHHYPCMGGGLYVHCLRLESPGAELIRQYQRAARGAAPDSGFLAPNSRLVSPSAAASAPAHCPG